MSAGWVAGRVRARGLARRRLGPGRARSLAGCGSLHDALASLAATPYGHGVAEGQDLASAQHAVAETLLWHLRVLAGWLPRGGAAALRAVAGWFELANVDGLLQRLDGRPAEEPYVLGALGTAWPRLRDARDIAELRERLAASSWGDPGETDPWAIRLFLRLSWAARVHGLGGRATAWASGAAAVLVAGERFGAGRELSPAASERAARLLGRSAVGASALGAMTARLDRDARWPLAGVDDPAELWRAEARCWRRLDRDGELLLRGSEFGAGPVLGAAGVLAVDAWRVRAALEVAARGGGPIGAYDAVA
ncbi:hypothetical protein [Actinomadura chibensis]|uniref:V-type ATPase subunit n=1 Tax=Actinomadura chibensis TaxID=392828 RepID=A0A5D0N6Z2_9ACTN|nr:hypothetical protein [Actinomadura chibensis]TYB40150.1 hypothetical protein FXF69_39885 [Actinomadura chibensis]